MLDERINLCLHTLHKETIFFIINQPVSELEAA